MISHILFTIVSSVFGIMLFFSFVVAPIGFKSLSEKNFRKFIRTIFPYYYSVNLVLLTLVAITIFIYYGFVFDLIPILICIMLFVFSLFILMPLINKYRDQNKKKKFKYAHTSSVIINFLQMILLVTVIF
jgi:ABC-type transport system involved in Fe-S cluster assembly fused permease/ATPase subunit